MSTAPTLQDIAQKLKLAKSTVSYALRNDPRVTPETRERVQRVARQMGYQKNPLVAAWMHQVRSGQSEETKATLAVISCYLPPQDIKTNPSAQLMLEGIRHHAKRYGYAVDVFWLHPKGLSGKRLNQILKARGIYGVIFLIPPVGDKELSEFDFSQVSSAAYSYRIRQPDLHRVATHHPYLLNQAAKQLLESGSNRIGLALSGYDDEYYHHFRMGWASVGFNLGAKKIAPLLLQKQDCPKKEEVLAYVQNKQIDGLLISNVLHLHYIGLESVDFPPDFRLAVLNRISGNSYPGMSQKNEAIGAALVDLVVGQLNRNERGLPSDPKTVLIKGEWQEVESAPAKA